jgi:IclR family pca regulon transcriptional regulator
VSSTTNDSALHNASIVKGFRVLEAFDRGRAALTLTQLVEITGLEKSAVQRFTATLVELGYLRKDPVRRHYTISPRLLHLGTSYLRTNPLVERAMPYLLEWSREHNETINLGELDGLDVIISYRFRTRQVVSSDIAIGSRFPWHVTSIGQAVVAFLPEDQRGDLLDRSKLTAHAARTITDKKDLAAKLEQVRQQGYSFCEGESYDEDVSIAAPVFNSEGQVTAAVATAVLLTKWTPQSAKEKLASSVSLLAKAITGLTRNSEF